MGLIRENKVLNDEFNVYNAFTNPINVDNPKEYVAEAISLVTRYSKKTIRENNEKLINLFKEYNLNENISVDDNEIELFENIEYLLLHNKDFKNLTKYNDIQNKLCEYVTENNVMLTESVNVDALYEDKLNEVIDKHDKELNDDEINLIMEVNDPIKAKKLFSKYKTEVTSLINEQIKSGKDVESWQDVLDKINSKVYEQKTALTNIAEFIEIKNEIEK
jgi:aryl carrier-like protein